MLHHVSLGTADLERARAFYDAVLVKLGLRRIQQTDRIIGYGLTDTMFSLELPIDGGPATCGNGCHVAFRAGSRKGVREAYEAGLAAGGSDEGKPGIRESYDPNYYAAFMRDPDGNKIEVVTFTGDDA